MRKAFLARSRRAAVCCSVALGALVAVNTTLADTAIDGQETNAVPLQPGVAGGVSTNAVVSTEKMPELAQPSWDQLMNGSLDQRWVEIRGLTESLLNRKNGWSRVELRTRDGVLKIELRRDGIKPGPLEQYENAVIRLRGKMFAAWDIATGRVKVAQLRMYESEIVVDQPAPADLFSIPRRTAASLMRYDPEYDSFRRVKVSGQIVYVRDAVHFMMDGADGLRFVASPSPAFETGDLVEAVGFPELSGAAPVLRGAVARKTGHAALPEPKRLSPDDLIRPALDSIRVRVEGLLASVRQTPTNMVLEMQAGSWRFMARLKANKESVPALRIGSKLDLTGVYCAQGGYKALGEDVAAVDLLLNSPADIRVLATPSWWTLQRMLVVVGVLACVLAAMVLWNTQLRRQVEERTAELATQIQTRQRVEHQRVMEEERARIAQDLHDELGSGITEITMLAARASSVSVPDETRNRHLDQVGGKAREMVTALDEIVWAMNPAHDSLASLVSYFCLYAERFLGLANISWRLEGTTDPPDLAVDSRHRHQLFLAFKEALTNIVRHSGATEVRLNIQVEQKELRLSVADNGCGLPAGVRTGEMNGVANMRTRIEKLGGRFEITGENGSGTTARFCVPLN